MIFSIYQFPAETNEIIERLKKRNWIVHAFQTAEIEGFYQPELISYNVDEKGVTYSLVLDTNIYQYLLNSSKKLPSDLSRDAVALLFYCQICDIQIDPTYAVYEKIDYQNEKAEEVISDLALFHRINNSRKESLLAYAIGEVDTYELGKHIGTDEKQLTHDLTKYNRLTEWDSIYVILLACVSISLRAMRHRKKLETFIYWMQKRYRQSFIETIYDIFFFSERRFKKMMKYKATDSPAERRQQLHNMTWDLYIQNSFFRKWASKNHNTEFAYATADKVLRDILQIGINIQIAGDLSPLVNALTQLDYDNVCRVWNIEIPENERVYKTKEWTPEYRAQLIEELEKELLS